MNHLTIANIDTNMANTTAARAGEEHQIARLKLGLRNLLAARILRSRGARNRLAKVCVYVLGQTGAVKGTRASGTVYIGAAQEALCIRSNRRSRAIGLGRRSTGAAAVRRSRRSGVLAADVAIAAAVLDLVPAAGGAYNRSSLAGTQNTDNTIRSACARANIQRGCCVYGLVGRSCRSNRARRVGRHLRGGVLAADVAIAAAVLNLVPAVGRSDNRSAVALLQVADYAVGGACTGTNIQRRSRDINGLGNALCAAVRRSCRLR